MIDALEMKALQEQGARESRERQRKLQEAVLVKICGDARLADIVRVFEAGDERRKQTVWRLACALSGKGL